MTASKDIAEKTKARLQSYGLFSDATIKTVTKVAQQQVEYARYEDYFKGMGLPAPALHYYTKRRAVPVVDVAPRQHPEQGVIAMHLPMGNPLDANQLYQVATMAATLPAYRIVAFGNPSGAPYRFKQQGRSLGELWRIAFGRSKQALVAGELDYLSSMNYENVCHVGYSYGAHKALIASTHSSAVVAGIVLVDPVAHSRYARQLLGDFKRTFGPMGEYVNRTGVDSYFEARKATAGVRYNAGLVRPVNLAVGMMLSRLDFIPLLGRVAKQHPHARITVAWGSASELGNPAHLQANLHNLGQGYRDVRSYRLEGDTHTFANDIHLHAAIICESLSGVKKA